MSSYIAFFDLDKTITGAVSGNEIAKSAYRKGLMTKRGLARALWLSLLYKLSLRDPKRIVVEMAGWVKGLPEETLREITGEVVNEKLIPAIYNDALLEIEMHRKQNSKIVLLSSTTEEVARHISAHVGLDDYLCSVMEVKNGLLTGLTVRPLCFAEEKAVRMREYCETFNTKLAECWYYGDSLADSFALDICGTAVCVNPDKKLRKMALKKKWKIALWK